MSLNGLGQFIVNSTGNPTVSGTTISTTWANALTADLATALSTAVFKDGQQTMTANIPWGGFKITGLGAPTILADALSWGQAASITTLIASGTITPQALVDISGASAGQIKFPATQNASANANTLDDYEEGTFTPALSTGTSGTITPTTATGFYTKVGDRVFVNVYFLINTVSSPLGSLTMTGLPFTSANISGNNTSFVADYIGFSGATNYTSFAKLTANDTLVTLQKIVGNAPANLAGDVQAASEIYISGHYKAAT